METVRWEVVRVGREVKRFVPGDKVVRIRQRVHRSISVTDERVLGKLAQGMSADRAERRFCRRSLRWTTACGKSAN